MPINDFQGAWKYTANLADLRKLQQQLPIFQSYLKNQGLHQFIDTDSFAIALKQGLYFDSNIPTGYGIGSSGALCAAILDRFDKKKEPFTLLELKTIFARMESFFHGASSGTDPLVSYLNYPIILGEKIEKVNFIKENSQSRRALFLLDTGVKREASPFINEFLKRCEVDYYNKRCETQLVPLVDDAIQTFLNGQWQLLFDTWHELSLFQFRYFDFMILDAFKTVWLDGLGSDTFKLKICGAGGGGFMLGISNDYAKTQQALKNYTLRPIYNF